MQVRAVAVMMVVVAVLNIMVVVVMALMVLAVMMMFRLALDAPDHCCACVDTKINHFFVVAVGGDDDAGVDNVRMHGWVWVSMWV